MSDILFTKSLFQIKYVLPPYLVIKGADSHLYKNGLSLFESSNKIKRKWYYSPQLISLCMMVSLIKHLTLLFIDLRGNAHLILGDVDYFCQMMGVSNSASCICNAIILCSQLINVYNKRNDIKPDLRVFEMMAGFTSPESISLKDKQLIIKLIRFSKRSLLFVKISKISLTMNVFVLVILVSYLMPTSMHLLTANLIRISWALFYAIWMLYFVSVLYYQFAYFTILCYYLHLKLTQINRKLVNKEKNIYRVITEFTDVYQEISEYNSNYWSKFLLVIYTAMSSLIATNFFASFVAQIPNPLIKAMLFNYAMFNSFLLLFIIGFSSLIYNDCVLTYRLLNSYVHSVKRITRRNRIKVSHIYK